MAQDQEAFTALYRRHYGDVLRYARRRVDEQQARDIAAETFLVAWRRFAAVPDADEALPWLYAVARNTVAGELRRQRRALNLSARLQTAAGQLTVHPDHADALAERDHLAAALTRLSPRDREAVQLVAWEALDIKDAAAVAGCSPIAMKVRLHRARRRLVRILHDSPSHPSRWSATSSSACMEARK